MLQLQSYYYWDSVYLPKRRRSSYNHGLCLVGINTQTDTSFTPAHCEDWNYSSLRCIRIYESVQSPHCWSQKKKLQSVIGAFQCITQLALICLDWHWQPAPSQHPLGLTWGCRVLTSHSVTVSYPHFCSAFQTPSRSKGSTFTRWVPSIFCTPTMPECADCLQLELLEFDPFMICSFWVAGFVSVSAFQILLSFKGAIGIFTRWVLSGFFHRAQRRFQGCRLIVPDKLDYDLR